MTAPQGADPIEDLHAGRHRDCHGHQRKCSGRDGAHARGEHVVAPHPEAKEADAGAGKNHDRVTEQRLREKVGRISETIPIAGRIKIYTSGCPKTQNKCCQRMGKPPLETSKKVVPKERSIINSTRAIVIAGKERIIKKAVIKVIQVKTGRRIIVMPGARRLMIVTMKLSEPMTDETPSTCKPSTQRSVDISVLNWLLKAREVSGA